MSDNYLVFDVGKTHVKVSVLSTDGEIVYSRRTSNAPIEHGLYTALDLDGIRSFLFEQLREVGKDQTIRKIGIATHGAAAVIIDRETGRPALPAMDYEYDGYGDDRYDRLRPPFDQTYSPLMPSGLNLGRQIHHQLSLLTGDQQERAAILLYPNYWAWLLTGVMSSEVTSLGCHTDLWDVPRGEFSSLVDRLGIRAMLPPLRKASEPLGRVLPDICAVTGLPPDCIVFPGMHDSNAGYYPHLAMPPAKRPTVISTGTWSVAMSPQTPLTSLRPELDMLANVDADGTPVATARYMGGREFARICEMTNCDVATDCQEQDLAQTIDAGIFGLPSFEHGSGPFAGRAGSLVGRPWNGKALATLYSALMLDQLLTNLSSRNDIVIEGSFASNDLLCATLAALRPTQAVHQFRASGGVISGCYAAMTDGNPTSFDFAHPARPLHLPGLDGYAREWRRRAADARDPSLLRHGAEMSETPPGN
ncbi:FGGY-family carbohydrate kinase [Aquisalinus flavus]|nr:FGGY family carbohydrate kinase [Aquisalinus flavus]MBD0425963.1 hypothetical protein [Aquisalinus flavus]